MLTDKMLIYFVGFAAVCLVCGYVKLISNYYSWSEETIVIVISLFCVMELILLIYFS